ncbi:3 beta-hydroxysteroid dehydrogenase/Delta 5--_4-isomerase [Anaerolineales bacterium]|nr:3 beta-hydroxysteroid dehydrogenase/Delta 5-->4-isomerase [Anaerolineales bacterium]
MSKLILVTGATGYIASRLIPQLLDRGYTVRALARNPHCLYSRSWYDKVEIVQGDVMEPESLKLVLQDVHTAYYLIHNMSHGYGYTKLETHAARNFASAAEQAGVRHIIYLGGLADNNQPISPHMRSRMETGAALREGRVPVTEFRASVIIGSGSISFEMIRFMTELFPVIPSHVWLKNWSQPIAIQNVMDYLLAALEKWEQDDRVLEIGGPEVMTYQDLMRRYARACGHKRGFLFLPYIPVKFMAFGVGLVTPVPRRIARALVRGMSDNSIVKQKNGHEVYPEINLVDFDSALRQALEHLHPLKIECVWAAGDESPPGQNAQVRVHMLRHEGFFITHTKIMVDAKPERVFNSIKKLAESLETRQFVLDTIKPDQLLLLKSQKKIPGKGWLEWSVSQVVMPSTENHLTCLSQTSYFAPRGLPGFLYWYLLYPLHILKCRSYIQGIKRECSTHQKSRTEIT